MALNEPITDEEGMHIVKLISEINNASTKQLRHLRRRIRYRIFRIRDGRDEFDMGLRKHLESQLSPDQSFDKFTFNWDVSPRDPLKVITPYEWSSEGGKFETVMVACDDGVTRPQKVCDPSAFTKQA